MIHEQPRVDLRGKVALISGGANGLGQAFARALAGQGADIIIADLDLARAERVISHLQKLHTGSRTLALETDIRDDGDVRSLARDAVKAMGRVDILVNAAAVLLQGRLEQIKLADWQWMLETNLLGTIRVTRALLPHFRLTGGGHIVNAVPRGALLLGDVRTVPYDSGFAALISFTQGLALDLKGTGIRVSLVAAGARGPRLGQSTRSRGVGRWFDPESTPASTEEPGKAAESVAQALVEGLQLGSFLILADDRERELVSRLRPDIELSAEGAEAATRSSG